MTQDMLLLDLSDAPLPTEDVGAVEAGLLERRAVEGWKPWRHVSASQVQSWRTCQRAWGLEKVGGLRGPTSANLQLGTDVHAHLERWLVDRTTGPESDKAWAIASAGLHLLPRQPLEARQVERRFALEHEGLAVPLVGSIDFVDVAPDGHVRINDHKTVSDWKWAKTEEQLQQDVQATIYATAYVRGYNLRRTLMVGPQAYQVHSLAFLTDDEVTFRHIQYRTKTPYQARETQTILSMREVAARYDGIVADVAAMALVANKDPRELAPTLTACSAYGGCPRRGVCAIIDGTKEHVMQGDLFAAKSAPALAPPRRKKPNALPDHAAMLNPPEADSIMPEPVKPDVLHVEHNTPAPVVRQQEPSTLHVEHTMTAPAVEPTSAQPEGVTLLVGCLVRSGHSMQDVATVVASITKQLAKRAGVDWYCSGAEKEYRNPYRSIAAVMATKPLPPGWWYVDPTAPWAPEVLEVLTQQATTIIQATR